MASAKKVRIKLDRGESVGSFASQHSTYKARTVYIPTSESNDNAGYFRVSENIDINLMDSWLLHDSSFDGLHVRTAHGCRALWDRMPKPTRLASDQEGYSHAKAAATLAKIKRSVPRSDWLVFENAMRWNEPGGYPGSRYAVPNAGRVTATKAVVRRVLEAIAR